VEIFSGNKIKILQYNITKIDYKNSRIYGIIIPSITGTLSSNILWMEKDFFQKNIQT
jgi:hypothetical protein